MSIIAWLQQNAGSFFKTGYHIANQWEEPVANNFAGIDRSQWKILSGSGYSEINSIYGHRITSVTLKNRINEISNTYEQRKAISVIDGQNKQNAFHFMFSNKVYSGVYSSIIYTTVLELAARTSFQSAQLKSANEHIAEQQPLLIDELLAPFQDQEATEDLVSALSALDAEGNTPLHCLIKMGDISKYPNFIAKLASLSIENKEKILLKKDKNGQTIFHILANLSSYPDEKMAGEELLKKAFFSPEQVDKNGNLPLHIASESRTKRLDKIKIMCKKLNPSILSIDSDAKGEPGDTLTGEEKETPAMVVAFQQNPISKKNPFHLTCQSRSDTALDDIHVFKIMRETLPKKMFIKKMMEQDNLGNTPLVYAIQANEHNIVEAIFKDLTPQEKSQVAKIANKKQETSLHFARQYGDERMLEMITGALGITELHHIQKNSSNLPKTSLSDKMTPEAYENKINALGNVMRTIDYFIKTKIDKDYNARLNDFIECLEARVNGLPLPIENEKFKAKKHVIYKGSERYHNLRKGFIHITQAEIDECKAYYEKNPPVKDKAKNAVICRILKIQPKNVADAKEGDTEGCSKEGTLQILTSLPEGAAHPSAPPAEISNSNSHADLPPPAYYSSNPSAASSASPTYAPTNLTGSNAYPSLDVNSSSSPSSASKDGETKPKTGLLNFSWLEKRRAKKAAAAAQKELEKPLTSSM